MLIGTAGHIDHGKTTLVRALTGVDTDRLPEEKQRGITIELGYAYAPLADGQVLAFIDVPGHERFVPTMLMGAAGIDYALLVVAADDGVMPQTREHLAILHLLGVGRGAVALTKCDRVPAARVAEVAAEVGGLLAPTRLAGSPVFAVSAASGEGVPALSAHLEAVAKAEPQVVPAGGFRLVVDRRFAIAGAGTIVTGSVHAGTVRIGDRLLLARPSGFSREVRVRGLHVNSRRAEAGGPGSRCAVNLAGIDYGDIERGDWLLAPALACATDRLDLRLHLLPEAGRRLGQWAGVTLHHAGGHAMARLALLDGALEAGGLAPGASGLVQAVLDRPVFACHGDRVVIRDAAGRETLGGGRVLDPFPSARHRRRPERLALLAALEDADPAARLAALLEAAPAGLDADEVAAAHNLPGDGWRALLPAGAVALPRPANRLLGAAAWARLGDAILARLAAHHADFADEPGVERERLRRMCAPQLPSPAFQARLEALLADGLIGRAGSAWHLPAHTAELGAADRARADELIARLAAGGFDPPWVRDLAAACALAEADVRSLLRRLAMRGEVFQVVRDLFYARGNVAEMQAIAAGLAAGDDRRIRAADFRDRIGGGRKRAIQILEFFDRVGYTRRVGEGQRRAHVLRGEPPVPADEMPA
ncbi:selenocysteine-specific translation elongation factor [Thauera sinica]|uniref:Selenocysteine-specific elongation factor n=1 Tax=Thauera sinica TaxID=2665146 RepID=A0ABW1ALC6_9RHOO|nr:selenocysteine-specific translation elongation factor [Thauera sp. K11]ATE62099.1 selenocysteine-specific translation elongation factor [Thauera sp. K11]